jgi:hypothetical protein
MDKVQEVGFVAPGKVENRSNSDGDFYLVWQGDLIKNIFYWLYSFYLPGKIRPQKHNFLQ